MTYMYCGGTESEGNGTPFMVAGAPYLQTMEKEEEDWVK